MGEDYRGRKVKRGSELSASLTFTPVLLHSGQICGFAFAYARFAITNFKYPGTL